MAKICPTCRASYDDAARFCINDGATLVDPQGVTIDGPSAVFVTSDPFVGTLLQEKYRIEKLLGAGGMGRVYQALNVDLDKRVAIKVMSKALSDNAESVERFRVEARAMARIDHANAVKVLDFTAREDLCFLVMEHLTGESLRDRLNRGKRLPVDAAAAIAEQVCRVLEFMHAEGVTHRDLKPDNIFLHKTSDGMETVKVLDFGLAKLHSTESRAGANLTQSGMMMGTPNYMSPEQCRGAVVDNRTDLYSLGIVLYEMLSGKVPFDGDSASSIGDARGQRPDGRC